MTGGNWTAGVDDFAGELHGMRDSAESRGAFGKAGVQARKNAWRGSAGRRRAGECGEGRVERGSLVEEGDERRRKEGRMVGRKSVREAQGGIGGHGVVWRCSLLRLRHERATAVTHWFPTRAGVHIKLT